MFVQHSSKQERGTGEPRYCHSQELSSEILRHHALVLLFLFVRTPFCGRHSAWSVRIEHIRGSSKVDFVMLPPDVNSRLRPRTSNRQSLSKFTCDVCFSNIVRWSKSAPGLITNHLSFVPSATGSCGWLLPGLSLSFFVWSQMEVWWRVLQMVQDDLLGHTAVQWGLVAQLKRYVGYSITGSPQ
jgi:hypothetical protein